MTDTPKPELYIAETNGAVPTEEPGITLETLLPPHSWTPVNLVAAGLAPPEPPTISRLVYPGRRHLFSGEPESLKSWAAMILCAEQIAEENTVAYIDFEMGPRETLSRLRDLDLTDEQLTNHFLYLEPDQPYEDPEIVRDTQALLRQRNPTLIIIDAMTGALQIHKLDPNKSVDIEAFYRNVLDPLRAEGAAIVVLDHLPKDTLNRGKFAIGSERKVGATEVHLGFEAVTPFGRGRTGLAKITTHKDRPGHLNRPRAAELELRSDPDTNHITWKLTHPDPTEPGTPFRPTNLMEKVSRHLENQADVISLKNITDAITGRTTFVIKAVERLAAEGYASEETGPRNARLFAILTPYRDDEKPPENSPEP